MNIGWIDAKKQLPENNSNCVHPGIFVLILMKTERGFEIGKGFHARKHEIIDETIDVFSISDYCEDTDENFLPVGWYDVGADEDNCFYWRYNVVAWMPMKDMVKLWEIPQRLDKIYSVDFSDASEKMGVDITETLNDEFKELL